MGKGIFITGTDTGVGKTVFAASLAGCLRERGYRVGVMKPVETGCLWRDGMLVPEDAIRLQTSAGCSEPIDRICPYRFAEPLAPSIAAERAGERIDIDRLLALYDSISEAHDATIVEGAGGLMVPLLPSYTYADLIAVLKLPTVTVAANRLGVLNHLVLTLEHASCRGVRLLGYVLNRVSDEASIAADTNREALLGLTPVPCLGELPFIRDAGARTTIASALFEAELDLRSIETALFRA